jgi:Concanavalin A-like lectin/glucanases superfamily
MTRHVLLSTLVLTTAAVAQSDSAHNDASEKPKLTPVMQWRFDDAKGPGPRPPMYPGFPGANTAMHFTGDGKKSVVEVKDSEALRFGLNDTITLEAWVKLEGITGAPYIIGKGRLGTKEFGANNQNYALRLQAGKTGAQIGFLFASANVPGGAKGEWHRWWSKATLPTAGWHHIAVTYTFGKPKSIKGYINGQETDGTWDMGGATDRPPVTDGDALLIGSGSTRAATHSFKGWLDDLAIYRGPIHLDTLKSRYRATTATDCCKRCAPWPRARATRRRRHARCQRMAKRAAEGQRNLHRGRFWLPRCAAKVCRHRRAR